MVRTVTIEDLQQRAGELLDDVARCGQPIFVEDDGAARGVVISVAEYERIERNRHEIWKRAWAAIDHLHELNADEDPDEVYRIVTEVVEEVRQERYDARQRDRQSSD